MTAPLLLRAPGGARIALVAGLRTPFVRRRTAFAERTALELGAIVVRELLARVGAEPSVVERVVFGQVVPSLTAPNIAREIVFESGMRPEIDAYSVSRACATSYQTAIDVALAIAAGEIGCGIAGGADSTSDVPIAVSKPLAEALIKLDRARTIADRVRAFRGVALRDLLPEPPAIAERSTGLTMGESAEKMARENKIPRDAQDRLAHRSHVLAARAWADGRFAGEVMTVDAAREDAMVRKDLALADLARLAPVFDPRDGTITAGNSSPLTDGASAVLLMREDQARALGLRPLAFLRAWAFTAVDPRGQLLMGPATAIPRALERAGLRLADLDLVDLHEAFAAQVLSLEQALATTVGALDWDRTNVMGGSIALGHPFAATGTRQLTQVARELQRRGGGLGLCSACAAGGLGAAIVIEVDPP
jgi:acetyl-CoA acyltransferase